MLRKTEILNMIPDIRLPSTRLRLMKNAVESSTDVLNDFFDQVLFGQKDNQLINF